MIFVTVGSQKFQFNRMLIAIDRLVDEGVITEPVCAQTGYSDYSPRRFEFTRFMDRTQFRDTLLKSDMLITHGGTGVIVSALKLGKRVIALPRLVKYHEHVDDHQQQLLSQFSSKNLLSVCEDERTLGTVYSASLQHAYDQYQPNNDNFIGDLDRYICSLSII